MKLDKLFIVSLVSDIARVSMAFFLLFQRLKLSSRRRILTNLDRFFFLSQFFHVVGFSDLVELWVR